MTNKEKLFRAIFFSAFIILSASACRTTQNAFDAESYRIAQTWLYQTSVIDLNEAYIAGNQIYLKYTTHLNETAHKKDFFAQVSLPLLKSRDDPSRAPITYAEIPLILLDGSFAKELMVQFEDIKRLSHGDWRRFRTQLAHALIPQEKNKANILKFDDREAVIFYDEQDRISICPLKQKPPQLQVEEMITQERLATTILEELRKYLTSINKFHSRVVLQTDPVETYNQLFTFVDFEKNLVVSIGFPADPRSKYKGNALRQGFKTFDYMVWNSHVRGILSRPVSSGLRLFAWSKDTAYDLVNPQAITLLERQPLPPLSNAEGMDLKAWEEDLDKLLRRPTQWGTIKFLIGGEAYFTRLIETIQDAKKTIEIRTFIFDNDDYAVQIADLLKEKSKQKGMKVKVLLDSMGQIMGEGKIPEDLPVGFNPPAEIADYLRQDSEIQVRVRPNAWFKADHTKTLTIDERITFTGGMNIGREYRYKWHDLMMEVEGPVVDEIYKEFLLAWEHASIWGDAAYIKTLMDRTWHLRKNKKRTGYPIRALYTRLNNSEIYRAQVSAIRKAQKYIYIHNAYFSDNTILYELIAARRRGVDVRVVLPVDGNHEIMNSSNAVTANIMFRNGIRVYFYPGMSHVKAAIFDGWVCSGSANFDKLSLRDNLEFNLATSEPAVAKFLLENLFDADFSKSKEMQKPVTHSLKDILGSIVAEQL